MPNPTPRRPPRRVTPRSGDRAGAKLRREAAEGAEQQRCARSVPGHHSIGGGPRCQPVRCWRLWPAGRGWRQQHDQNRRVPDAKGTRRLPHSAEAARQRKNARTFSGLDLPPLECGSVGVRVQGPRRNARRSSRRLREVEILASQPSSRRATVRSGLRCSGSSIGIGLKVSSLDELVMSITYLGQFLDRELVLVADVDRQLVAAVVESDLAFDLIVDVAEAPGLAPVAVDGDRLVLQCLDDEDETTRPSSGRIRGP